MAFTSSKIVAEYAKSRRSTCKKCAETISSKTLRLGLVSKDPRGFEATEWHHFNCFPMDSQSFVSVENIDGFYSLENSDQEVLKNLKAECELLPKETESTCRVGNVSETPRKQGRKRREEPFNQAEAEKNRRDNLKQKIHALRAVLPNLLKIDKPSVIDHATSYIEKLQSEKKELVAQLDHMTRRAMELELVSNDGNGST